jgi:hypothetical protein
VPAAHPPSRNGHLDPIDSVSSVSALRAVSSSQAGGMTPGSSASPAGHFVILRVSHSVALPLHTACALIKARHTQAAFRALLAAAACLFVFAGSARQVRAEEALRRVSEQVSARTMIETNAIRFRPGLDGLSDPGHQATSSRPSSARASPTCRSPRP